MKTWTPEAQHAATRHMCNIADNYVQAYHPTAQGAKACIVVSFPHEIGSAAKRVTSMTQKSVKDHIIVTRVWVQKVPDYPEHVMVAAYAFGDSRGAA